MMKGNKKRLKNNAETLGERKDGEGTQRHKGDAKTQGEGLAVVRIGFSAKKLIFNITLKPANCEISNLSVKPDTTQGHSRYSYCDLS